MSLPITAISSDMHLVDSRLPMPQMMLTWLRAWSRPVSTFSAAAPASAMVLSVLIQAALGRPWKAAISAPAAWSRPFSTPPVRITAVCMSITWAKPMLNTSGRPGSSAWQMTTPLRASALPSTSSPARVAGAVTPPAGSALTIIGMP